MAVLLVELMRLNTKNQMNKAGKNGNLFTNYTNIKYVCGGVLDNANIRKWHIKHLKLTSYTSAVSFFHFLPLLNASSWIIFFLYVL